MAKVSSSSFPKILFVATALLITNDGEGTLPVALAGAWGPSFSPSSLHAVSQEILLLSLQNKPSMNLTEHSSPAPPEFEPTWSLSTSFPPASIHTSPVVCFQPTARMNLLEHVSFWVQTPIVAPISHRMKAKKQSHPWSIPPSTSPQHSPLHCLFLFY